MVIPEKPNPVRFVNDYANSLTTSQMNQLEQMVRGYEDSTSTQIVIVIIKSTGGYDMYEYATELGRRWGIGQKELNNGIVLLWATDDRKVFIATGYGMEGVITDAISKQIINEEIIPNFKIGAYFEGLGLAIVKLSQAAKGEYKSKGRKKTNEEPPLALVLIIIAIILFALFTRGGRGFLFGLLASNFIGHTISSGRRYSGGFSGGGSFGGGGFGGGGSGECAQPTPKYIVTLNANGGIAGSTTTIEVESGKTATAPVSLPTRTSYVLLGWNTKEDGTGTAFVFGTTIVTADITIYAQWLGKPILTAKVVSSSQIDLSWTTSANATYYTLTDNGSEIATNINGTSYSHKDLVASSTHSYTVKACNTAGCSEASEAVSAKTDVVITVTELPKGIGHRYHYIAFSVTSSEPLTNYKMALKLSSEVAPTASELKSGLHITRNLSTKAHHNILYYTLNSNLLTKYPNATKSVILGKSTTDENADALLLSPGKSYKLYGLEEGTTTVKELKTFTTNTYTVGSIPFLADNYYGADGISVMDGYLYSKTVVQSVPTSRSIPNDRKYTFTHRNTDPPFMVFANQNRTGHYQWIYAIGDIGDNNIIHVVDVSFGHETKDLSKNRKQSFLQVNLMIEQIRRTRSWLLECMI
ncbi:hypothetical protein CHS0354_000582 [Potamilus streckersoni]|uniref:Fibronectin type-III domain-containing protein n=1 Tax=Potamilus streckersoni TaxID=2493646 RepID=A0AAE0W8E9_9BIVA|nr:hypothetical protein CHS0354_000582 [Potamilus streckersoni]